MQYPCLATVQSWRYPVGSLSVRMRESGNTPKAAYLVGSPPCAHNKAIRLTNNYSHKTITGFIIIKVLVSESSIYSFPKGIRRCPKMSVMESTTTIDT